MVRELLSHARINVNPMVPLVFKPFFVACQNGHLEIVRELLNHTGIMNRLATDGVIFLHVACQSPYTHGKKELFELLLNNGASLTHKNTQGETALDIAVRKKNTAAIEVIQSFQRNLDKENDSKLEVNSHKTKSLSADTGRFFRKKHKHDLQNNNLLQNNYSFTY